jgi:hypothetical protein
MVLIVIEECIEMLRRNPLAKVTGDNLDVYIKRNIISGMNKNKDIHLSL